MANEFMTTDDLTQARIFQTEVRKYYATADASEQLKGLSFEQHRENALTELSKELSPATGVLPQQAPVCRYLNPLLTTSCEAKLGALVSAIKALGPNLLWKVNQNYRQIFPEHFFENEAFCEIIGPGGLLKNQNIRVGLLLLGEEVEYPAHKHEATEWYHVINGTGLWQQGDSEYQLREPGSALFHSEWETHAMRCNSQPVLALWSWSGQLGAEAIASETGL